MVQGPSCSSCNDYVGNFLEKNNDSCSEMNVLPAAFHIFIAAVHSSYELHVQTPAAVSSWVDFCEHKQREEQVDL